MNEKIKIVYLYAEIMGYNVGVLKEFVENENIEVHVVSWHSKKLTSYKAPAIKNVTYYNFDNFNKKTLSALLEQVNPNIIYISGWQEKLYLSVVRKWKKKGVPVVSGTDDQWHGTLRQKIGRVLFPIILKKYFSHAWVAGVYQYEFARKLGFKKNNIIFNLLSADIELFNKAYYDNIDIKRKNYPHKFLFVGRFVKEKALDVLLQSWSEIHNNQKDWELCLIGDGDLRQKILEYPNIIVKDFLSTKELAKETQNYGCFILPSKSEQWGVVMHEFSTAGLPIICSDAVGSNPTFSIPNYNGYTFNVNDVDDLTNKMRKIINKSDEELIKMSENSHNLGLRISPEISAASFLSLIS